MLLLTFNPRHLFGHAVVLWLAYVHKELKSTRDSQIEKCKLAGTTAMLVHEATRQVASKDCA